MAKLHIKSGDTVYVNAGEDKGKTGKVLKVLVDDFLPRHKDAKNDDSLRLLSLKLDTPRIGELLDAYQNDFVDAVSEPKGVTVCQDPQCRYRRSEEIRRCKLREGCVHQELMADVQGV